MKGSMVLTSMLLELGWILILWEYFDGKVGAQGVFTCDCDRPAEIFISSVFSVTCDMTKISTGPDSIHTSRTSN
jgi:hypothetical protein